MTTSTSEKAKQFTLADSPVPSVERAPEPTSETATRPRAFLYMPVRAKFLLATGLSAIWFSISLLLAKPWLEELSAVTGTIPAFLIILFIALIPGFLNAHIVASLVLDSPPPLPLDIN